MILSTNKNTLKVSFSIALSIALTSCLIPVTNACAVEQSEIDAAKAQAEEIRLNIDSLQGELNQANSEYEAAVSAFNTATKNMRESQQKADETEKRIDELQEQLADSTTSMYKRGSSSSYLDVLLGANTFMDFVNGWDMMSRISSHEADLVQQTKDLRAELNAAKAEYQKQREQAESEMSIAQERQLTIATKKAELAEQVAAITEEISEMETQYELEAEAARKAAMAAQAATAAFQASLKAGEAKDMGDGYLADPCPDSWDSSGWGYRSFDDKFHLGVDMAANMGTPIYAAEKGTVIKTSTVGDYNGGAGNYVVIAHGNGLVTKYFHISAAFVAPGDEVERGQNIAAVGSTGKSTGPHLHFQVEIDGIPVCPYDFL